MEKETKRRIIITKRDREIVAFLEAGFMATSEMIDRLFFFSPTACRRRLVRLTEAGLVERVRADESLPFVYFKTIGRRKQDNYIQQIANKAKNETEQNRKLFLTQCLCEITQLGDLVFYKQNASLTTTVADLLAVVEFEDERLLVVADVLNRDGSSSRHKPFFDNSNHYNELKKTYRFKNHVHLVFAERMDKSNDGCYFIKKESGLSYRDYRNVDWSMTTYKIRQLLKSKKD